MIKTILYTMFRALEQSGQSRARRFLSLYKGSWQ